MTTSYLHKNRNYHNNNNYFHSRNQQRKPDFNEDRESAFFLGKLNKHHDREQVYNQLKRLTKELDFYIKRFDMPNGPNGRGNKGFAFVHCKNREQARQIISMKFLRLGNQDCEVKPYGGRTSELNSSTSENGGRGTPDSGCNVPVSAKFENPLKQTDDENNVSEVRSRMNSGIQVSESGRFSDKISTRNVSESDNNDEMQKNLIIPSEFQCQKQQEQYNEEISYEQEKTSPAAPPVNSHSNNADSDLRDIDYWLEEQTRFVLTQLGDNDYNKLREFMVYCDYLMEFLKKSDSQTIQEVQNIIGCI